MSVACGLCTPIRPKLCPRISGSGRISIFSPSFCQREIEGGGFEFTTSCIPLGPLGLGDNQFFCVVKYSGY